MTLKISISGVRGFVPDSLTPEVCLDFAKAFGTYLEGGKVVVGTDPRASSEFIKGIIFSGLLHCGCQVVDIGITPTPTVGTMVRQLKADGGIVITASHNPLPWNGLKFMKGDGVFLNEAQANRLLKIYDQKNFREGKPRGVAYDPQALELHQRNILKIISPGAIRRRRFKVALDCCNGAGSVICPKLLKKLGCQVIAINCDLSKPFPHPPEPVPANLGELSALVKKSKVDIGFALDSDADRLAIVDNLGRPIGEELTLVLAARFILKKNPLLPAKKRILVTNLSTTRALDDVAKELNATVIRTKIGEVHVSEELKELKGLIGGEGNGGVIYPPVGLNRDAPAGIALILNLLAAEGKKINEIVSTIPDYYLAKHKIACGSQDQVDEIIEKVKTAFKGNPLVTTDGVKILLPDAWLHVRASNTEPIVRVMAEARSREAAESLVRQVFEAVGQNVAGLV